MDVVQAAAAAASSLQVVDVGLGIAVQTKEAEVDATEPVGGLVRVTTGAPCTGGETVQVAESLAEPAMFVAVIVTVWDATDRPETLYGLVQAAAVPASRLQVTVVGLPVVVNGSAALVDVLVVGFGEIVTVGATTTFQAADADEVPVTLVTATTTVWAPAPRPV